jgi:AbiTii
MAIQEDIQSLILDLTDDKIELSKALIKAKSINKRTKNNELTELILGESEGRYKNNNLPEYRLIWGEPTFEFRNRFTRLTDIRSLPLPKGKHFKGKSTNFRPILFSVSEIEQEPSLLNSRGGF